MITLMYRFTAAIDNTSVNIPKASADNPQLQSLLGAVFGIAAIVAIIFIVLGGIRYSLSQGNATDLQKGKDMIVYALVGLVIVIFAFSITQFVTFKLF